MSSTSTGKRLAPDLGVMLASDMRTWPPELARHEAVGWIRAYRERGADWRRRTATFDRGRYRFSAPRLYSDPSFPAFSEHAERAARSALLWRVDLCIKLLLHIGWQWTTAVQLLEDTAEALTPHQIGVAAALARQQFQQRQDERQNERQDERGAAPGASPLMQSAVLRASDEQLEAALRSIYSDSRDLHAGRLKQAQAWWPDWLNEVSLLQWQAELVVEHPRSHIPFGRGDGALYDTLITLDRLCQPPVLLATMVRDGASREELLAPDPGMWSSADAEPISGFFAWLLNDPEMRHQRDAIAYWLQHSRLPEEVRPVTEPLAATSVASPARAMSAAAPTLAASAGPAATSDSFIAQGRYLVASGRMAEALEAYDRAIALQRDNVAAWLGKADILMRMRRPEEALATLDRAPRSIPHEDAQIWLHKRTIFDELGRFADARAAFERARAAEESAEEEAYRTSQAAASAFDAWDEAAAALATPAADEATEAVEAAEAAPAPETAEVAPVAEADEAAEAADEAADEAAAKFDTGYEP